MKSLGDISLVARVVALGDKRAFDALVRKHQQAVRRFFLHQTLGDTPLSDDLAQETFIKAYTHIGSFRGVAGFQTWLFGIAYRVFLDHVRSRKTTFDIDESVTRVSARTADGGLKVDERMCVTLQLVEGQPIERISAITGMSPGTVKSHLSRGKSKLATYLKENGYD